MKTDFHMGNPVTNRDRKDTTYRPASFTAADMSGQNGSVSGTGIPIYSTTNITANGENHDFKLGSTSELLLDANSTISIGNATIDLTGLRKGSTITLTPQEVGRLTITGHQFDDLAFTKASRTERSQAGMLVLSRKKDESIIIGDNIVITIVDIRGDKVRLGVEAPRDVSLHRKEIYEAIKNEQAGDETDLAS